VLRAMVHMVMEAVTMRTPSKGLQHETDWLLQWRSRRILRQDSMSSSAQQRPWALAPTTAVEGIQPGLGCASTMAVVAKARTTMVTTHGSSGAETAEDRQQLCGGMEGALARRLSGCGAAAMQRQFQGRRRRVCMCGATSVRCSFIDSAWTRVCMM
jgi:hypothetical protein